MKSWSIRALTTASLTAIMLGCSVAGVPVGPEQSMGPAIQPVSASRLSAEASEALDACSITDTTGRFGSNGAFGIDLVSGMGLVPHARDVPKYARLTGREPELQSDAPAWVIETSGSFILIPVGLITDATCVVIGGEFNWFATGSVGEGDDLVTAEPLPSAPMYRLPPLAP